MGARGRASARGDLWDLRALTAYDAVYVALTEALDATLAAFDERFANAPDHQARIELLR